MADPLLHRDNPQAEPLVGNIKVTRQDWLHLALRVMVSDGIEQVKVMTLADRMQVSRSSFYWYFKSRQALLDALLDQWETRTTSGMLAQAARPAATITEAVLQLQHCVVNRDLFDTPLDFAVRDWSRRSAPVRKRLEQADARRVAAIKDMFLRHGYRPLEAQTRARVLYYMQLGYDMAQLGETLDQRLSSVSQYLLVFTGHPGSAEEIDAFAAYARHHLG